MPVPLTAYTLLTADIHYLRTVLIRDDFQEHTRPITATSRYNQANSRQFVDDATLQLILDRIINEERALIEGAWSMSYAEHGGLGSEDPALTTAADTFQVSIMLYLLAAAVFEMMLRDRGYLESLGDDSAAEVANMQEQIEEWEQMAGSASGEWGFVDVYRY